MRKLMLLLIFLCMATPALAQRVLPAEAKRSQTGDPQALPMVQLGNEMYRLAPGGVIIDAFNRRIPHNQLPAGAEVLFSLDRNGELQRIILLTPEEQTRIDQNTR